MRISTEEDKPIRAWLSAFCVDAFKVDRLTTSAASTFATAALLFVTFLLSCAQRHQPVEKSGFLRVSRPRVLPIFRMRF